MRDSVPGSLLQLVRSHLHCYLHYGKLLYTQWDVVSIGVPSAPMEGGRVHPHLWYLLLTAGELLDIQTFLGHGQLIST